MDVSIIIVNWNTSEYLRGCLRSIYQETPDLAFEVVVIDNASCDNSCAMVRSEFPYVKLIANTKNKGFAAANNQGIRVAAGRYVLLLNPDTVVLDRAIGRCVRYADAHPDIGVLGCQVLESDHAIQQTGFSFPTPWTLFLTHSGLAAQFPRSKIFGKPTLSWWDRRTEKDLDAVSGMFMLVRRETFEQVGLMDESYFVYAEEADWCFRFARAGWRRVFTPIAKIIHLEGGGKSTSQINVKMFVQLQKSLAIYHRKNLGVAAWLLAKMIYVCSNTGRTIVWSMLSLIRNDSKLRSKAAAANAALRFHLLGLEPR